MYSVLRWSKLGIFMLSLTVSAVACAAHQPKTVPIPTLDPQPTPTASATSISLAMPLAGGDRPTRGVNLGNTLEAPYEGQWGMVLEESYFLEIAEAGFDSVRIPIRWSAHAATEPPYAISESLTRRVDWAVDQCLKRDLLVVINIHHYEEMVNQPREEKERFLALWEQIATHYAEFDERLIFELLNEPNSPLGPGLWNDYAAEALAVVRQTNPTRDVIVGPSHWNSLNYLNQLDLPDDAHLIVTFHYYEPFQFTHQGAEWVSNSGNWEGIPWNGTASETKAIIADLDTASAIAGRRGWRLYMGEFGAYGKADMDSRVRWTTFMCREAEKRGISWAYWEFGAGFGVYDRSRNAWRHELLEALIPPE